MSFKLTLLLLQATFLAAHYNDGCYIEDKTGYAGTIMDNFVNITTVFQCASLCRDNVGCSYWTLFKCGDWDGDCYLWYNMDNRLSSNCAISGSVSCGGGITSPTATTVEITKTTTTTTATTTTTTNSSYISTTTTTAVVSTLCRELINASKECGFDPAILLHLAAKGSGSGIHMIRVEDNVDEEHCEGFLEHLEEFCGI